MTEQNLTRPWLDGDGVPSDWQIWKALGADGMRTWRLVAYFGRIKDMNWFDNRLRTMRIRGQAVSTKGFDAHWSRGVEPPVLTISKHAKRRRAA